ncbi:MAG: spore germination protein [Oscillospiraceae bacterium]|nr:spore germination protein [Oscillospiraceae bacterium]
MLFSSLEENLAALRALFGGSDDLVERRFEIGGIPAAVLSCENMIDLYMLAEMVVQPLARLDSTALLRKAKPAELWAQLRSGALPLGDLSEAATLDDVAKRLASGQAAVLLEGIAAALCGGLQAFALRGVDEPTSEVTVRGPREGFTESARVNMSMVRRRLKTPQLTFEQHTVGTATQTGVLLCFRRDKVDRKLLDTLRERLNNIPLDTVLESGYIQSFLEGGQLRLFTACDTTERPDTLCHYLSMGRIGVLVDGTPFALVVPYLFSDHFVSMDDFAVNPYYATFTRLLKYLAFFVGLFAPGLFVAIGTHQIDMLPAQLLPAFLASTAKTPFPLVVDALLGTFLFEIMREAGLRFPKSVGHAVSIVGALVIGDTAVRVGLVSAPMLILVALASMCSFLLPSLYGSVAVLRFVFIFLGGLLGLYGVTLGACLLLVVLARVHARGTPFLSAPALVRKAFSGRGEPR